ncbi:sensor histidine kinase [Orrella marina]|nr:sensor histidine kinase [Orrella marina]
MIRSRGQQLIVDRMFRGFLMCLVMLAVSCAASAQSFLLQTAYYDDSSGRLTVDEVMAQSFTVFDGMLSEGYTDSVIWLRIRVKASDKPLYLTVKPHFLDTLTLYTSTAVPGVWSTQVAGDRVHNQGDERLNESHIFEIEPRQETTYYLRVKTTSTAMIEVQVLTFSDWYVQNMRTQSFQVPFIGLMFAILLWATSDFIVRREALVGWFVAVQVMQILFSLALMGYLAVFLPHSFNLDLLTSVIIQGSIAVTMLFHRMLIRPFQPSRWAVRVLDFLIFLAAIEITLILFGFPRQGLQLGTINLLFFIPTLLWLGYSTKVDAVPGRIALRVAYNALALALAIVIMPLLGWGQSVDFYINALTTQGVVSAIIMGVFLYRRSSEMEKSAIADQLKLERVEQGLRDHQLKLDEQRQFMDMLSHELKTPISVIQLTLDTLSFPDKKRVRLERALRTMSEVIDRCRLSTQIDEQRLSVVNESFDLAEMVEEVTDACLEPGKVDLDVDSVMVDSDRQLLSVVIHNLVDNAIKYSPATARVKVELGTATGRFARGTSLTVTNKFLGNQPPDSRAIFEKYVRGPTATGLSGSGLGLHLCRRLVQMLGGSLTCQVLDHQIVFTLWLPDSA